MVQIPDIQVHFHIKTSELSILHIENIHNIKFTELNSLITYSHVLYCWEGRAIIRSGLHAPLKMSKIFQIIYKIYILHGFNSLSTRIYALINPWRIVSLILIVLIHYLHV